MNKPITFLLCCLLYLTSCSDTPATSGARAQNPALAALFERYYQDNIALYPLEATANGDDRYNDKLYADFTDSYRAKIKADLEKYSKELSDFSREKLNDKDRINYDCLSYELKRKLDGLAFHSNYIPLEQIGGFHLTFAQMGSGALIQPFNTVQDYDNWLLRMKAFGPYVDSAITYFRKGIAAHYVLPKTLVIKMIPQMQNMVAADPKLSVFYQPILKLPREITAPEQARLSNAYREMIAAVINPAYQKLGAFLQEEYLPAARTSSGIWDVPKGQAYYDYAIRSNTSTSMKADEVYNLGLSEVKRIRTLMDSIKTVTGFSGDLKSFFAYLASDKRFMPFHNADEIIAAYENIHTRMKPQLRKLFLHEPRTPFEIRQIEAFRAKSGSSQYFQGSPDGKRPGVFYVLILDPAKYNVVEEQMESLFLHEAIPGHHYQISLQQEDTTLPAFRRFSTGDNAYIEGWALYCESLGKELGLYTDPYQYLGALGAEMHRAIRLVVDAGLHAHHMTREEAIQYMTDNEQISTEAATIEIERYMAWPGQALGYKVGSLTIRRLREECAKQQGAGFNIATFHNEVLKNGSMPLDILEQHIKEWAAQKK